MGESPPRHEAQADLTILDLCLEALAVLLMNFENTPESDRQFWAEQMRSCESPDFSQQLPLARIRRLIRQNDTVQVWFSFGFLISSFFLFFVFVFSLILSLALLL